MTISYPLTPPATPVAQSIVLRPSSTTGISMSPYTGSQQAYSYPSQLWVMDVNLPPMRKADALPWIAFLQSLAGRYGTFYMGDPTGQNPRGTAPGTPLVDGADQTGHTLDTKGWTPSQTGILLAGDYIEVSSRLHRVLADVDSDVSGNATIDIWPRIRTSPADSATVTTSGTKAIWRLSSDENQFDIGNPFFGISFSAVEAI